MSTEKEQTIESVMIRRRKSYEENSGRFVGEVEYQGMTGKVTLTISEDVSEKLLEFLAPVLVEYSRRVALQIADDITRQVAALKTPALEMGGETPKEPEQAA